MTLAELFMNLLESRVGIIQPEEPKELKAMDRKFSAKLLLADKQKRIHIPSGEEWIGLNELDRDLEL